MYVIIIFLDVKDQMIDYFSLCIEKNDLVWFGMKFKKIKWIFQSYDHIFSFVLSLFNL